MKRKLMLCLLCVALVVLIPNFAFAANTYSSGAITIDTAWSGTLQAEIESLDGFTSANDVTSLTITATDTIDSDDLTYIQSLSNLTDVSVANTVTVGNVGDDFFKDHTKLENITFPMTQIGNDAFYGCSALVTADFPLVTTVGNNAFATKQYSNSAPAGCDALTTVSMDVVTSVGDVFLANCYAVNSVTMPATVTFGDDAFLECESLLNITLNEVLSFGNNAFAGCGVLITADMPKVTTFGDDAFYGCSSLTTVDLPLVETFGDDAFATKLYSNSAPTGCDALVTVSFPNATTFGDSPFADCDNLTTVSLPSVTTFGINAFDGCAKLVNTTFTSAETFGNDAFAGCSVLTEVNMPEVLSFGDDAFYNCQELETISMPKVQTFGNGAFSTRRYSSSYPNGCDNLTSIQLPEVTTFGDLAFNGCDNLTRVEMPNATTFGSHAFTDNPVLTELSLGSLNEVGSYFLYGSDAIQSVSLPVVTIGSNAFESCDALEGVTLANATSLGNDAFKDCDALTSVSGGEITTLGLNAFYDCDGIADILLPKLSDLGDNAFYGCNLLTSVQIPALTIFRGTAFTDVPNKIDMILGSSVPSVQSDAFTSYDPSAKGARIYVPDDDKTSFDNADSVSDNKWYGWALEADIVYTITYNLNAGTNNVSNPDTFRPDDLPITLADPSRSGYTFGGWYTDVDLTTGNEITQITTEADEEIWAKWTAVEAGTYIITYNLNGGTNNASNPATFTSGDLSITLAEPTRSGYAFGGWYKDVYLTSGNEITQITVAADEEIWAKWIAVTPSTYTITYNLNGGTNNAFNPATFTSDDLSITLADPTKTDYTFGGWYTDVDLTSGNEITQITAAADEEIWAKWTADSVSTYAITYNLDGGTNNASNPATFTSDDLSITLADPTKTDYTFGGWYTDVDLTTGNEITQITTAADEEIWAKWTAVEAGTYTITYNLNGGTNNASNPATFTSDDLSITLADPTRTGYTFGGWYTDIGLTAGNEITQITAAADEEIWAKWTEDATTYTITYELNGGTNSSSNPSTFTEDTETITLASPTKSGSVFAGWYTDASFTAANKVTQIVKGTKTDITLYAKWTQSFTLVYNANGGNGSASVAKSGGSTFNLYNGSEFTRSGYVLEGWASSSSAATPNYLLGAFYTMPASDTTLYAVWVADADGDGISDADEKAVGTDPNDDDDKPKTAKITGKVLDSDDDPVVGAIVILNSDPVTTTTNSSGVYEFDGVSLSSHTLTITDNGVTLGTFTLNFTEGSANSYSVSDSGSTDSNGVINIVVTGDPLVIEVDVEQNAAGEWQVADVDLKDSSGNDLPATATNNYLLLIISLIIIVGAAVGVALLIRKMRNSN